MEKEKRSFDESVGGRITRKQADAWIGNYQKSKVVKSHFFGRKIIELILKQEGCVGISMYYALDNKGDQQLLLVGTHRDGTNIWPSVTATTSKLAQAQMKGASGVIADNSMPCPPICPK